MPPPMSSDESRSSVESPAIPLPGSGADTLRSITISSSVPTPRWASAYWLAFLGLAVAEVLALWVRQSRVLDDGAYRAAAAVVRESYESNDAVTISPGWADPLLRLHLGDRMGAKVSGRTDLAPFERLWVLSIRGARAPEAPRRAPDFQKVVQGITIERYDFAPSPVVVDLVDILPTASVEMILNGEQIPCPFRERVPGAQRGGLFFGPAAPRQRFVCDGRGVSTWVGATVIEDLHTQPRRCILQRALGPEPLSVTYRDVHLGRELVLYAGLYYIDERDLTGVPVEIRVLVNGQQQALLIHNDGDGMKRYRVDLQKQGAPSRGDLRIEVAAPDGIRRSLCWSGSIRDTQRREAP